MLFNYWNFLSVTNNTFISHLVYSIESCFWFTSHALHSLQSCLSCRITFDSPVMLFILYSHACPAESHLIHQSCSSFSTVMLVLQNHIWFTSHALHSLQSCFCRIIFDSQVMLFILYSHACPAESHLIHQSCSSFSTVMLLRNHIWFTSHALHSLQLCLSCRITFDSPVMLFILYSHASAKSYLIHKSCSSFSIVILVIVCIQVTFYLLLVVLSHQLTALCSYRLTIDDSKNLVPDNNDSKNAVTDTQFIAVSPLRKMFMNISYVAQFSKVLHPFDASEAFAKIHAILMQQVKKVFIWIYNKFVNSLFHCYYSWSHFRYFL